MGAAPALLDKQKLKIQEGQDPHPGPDGWGSLFLTKAAPWPVCMEPSGTVAREVPKFHQEGRTRMRQTDSSGIGHWHWELGSEPSDPRGTDLLTVS